MSSSSSSWRAWGVALVIAGIIAFAWQRARAPAPPAPAPSAAPAAEPARPSQEAASPVTHQEPPARPPEPRPAAPAARPEGPSQPVGLIPTSPPQNEAERRALIAKLPEVPLPPEGDPQPPLPERVQELSASALAALSAGDLPRASSLLKQAEDAAEEPVLKDQLRARRMHVAADMGDTIEAGRLAESLQGSGVAPATKKDASDLLERIRGGGAR